MSFFNSSKGEDYKHSDQQMEKMTDSVSLGSLPEDLLVGEVASRVASSSMSDIENLQSVSKLFLRLCNERYVLHHLPLHKFSFCPWKNDPKQLAIFLKKCRKSGNPEAIYRKGFVNYFHRNSDERLRDKGLQHIAKAAEKGFEEAQYVYGLILICLGGKDKEKGFQILSSLKKPLMSSTINEMVKHRRNTKDDMLWIGAPMMGHLQRSYVREKCNCDGSTDTFFEKNCGWERYIDRSTASVCNICLCHHVVKLFFDH